MYSELHNEVFERDNCKKVFMNKLENEHVLVSVCLPCLLTPLDHLAGCGATLTFWPILTRLRSLSRGSGNEDNGGKCDLQAGD
ncbi:hypothetical protein J6590_071857 [Homalodisca vitripennis]|nr:hypothetical protein J6590_071857 [Homalodisca vitripennis]